MKIKPGLWAISLLAAVLFTYVLPLGAGGGSRTPQPPDHDRSLWKQYKSSFISSDGRVIDYFQGKASHSEGQGYAMLLAVSQDDRETFAMLWGWTRTNLALRSDGLFAWKWGRKPDGQWKVIDLNNATDGDMLIALALLKAEKKWGGDYGTEGLRVVRSIRENLAVEWQGLTLLLPSYYGFVRKEGFVINPSYFIFPAMRHFAEVDDRGFWEKVRGDTLSFTGRTLFGRLSLPADWVLLSDGGASVFTEKSTLFGHEAVRVLLHLSFDSGTHPPPGLERILGLYEMLGYIPLWVDLARDGFSLESSPAGFYAVYALAAGKNGRETLSKRLFEEAETRLASEENDYYSFSLYFLATGEGVF